MSLDVKLFVVVDGNEVELFERNITNNLVFMAKRAGLYGHVWRPEENGVECARDLIPVLETGLRKLVMDRSSFEELSPKNGWGTYGHLVEFVQAYLDACKKFPSAIVGASR